LRAFVRDTLGCSCPEAVFDSVAVGELVVDGQVAGTRLVIGDRLLIYLVERAVPSAAIGALAAAGLADRDRHGLNRLRLVVGAADRATADALETAFAAAIPGDAKAHLHCVSGPSVARSLIPGTLGAGWRSEEERGAFTRRFGR
jgi:hypothetical protein